MTIIFIMVNNTHSRSLESDNLRAVHRIQSARKLPHGRLLKKKDKHHQHILSCSAYAEDVDVRCRIKLERCLKLHLRRLALPNVAQEARVDSPDSASKRTRSSRRAVVRIRVRWHRRRALGLTRDCLGPRPPQPGTRPARPCTAPSSCQLHSQFERTPVEWGHS